MADYKDPDEFVDTSKIPWGSVDFGSNDPAKKDTLRQSWWATNRGVYAMWDMLRDSTSGLVTIAKDLVRVRTYVARIETKVDALTEKIDKLAGPGN